MNYPEDALSVKDEKTKRYGNVPESWASSLGWMRLTISGSYFEQYSQAPKGNVLNA